MNHRFLILAAGALSACASTPPAVVAPTPTGVVLGYAETGANVATYAFTDSSGFDIQGGAVGNINAKIGSSGVAEVTYAPKAGGLEAVVVVKDFTGSMTNSAMGGGPTATEADITGPGTVTLTPAGASTVVSMPTLSKAAEGVGLSRSFFRRFFIRLPARAVQPGAVWIDTLTVTDESGGSKADVQDIQTSTFVKDTVVNGRTLAVITTAADRTLKIAGVNEGVEIKQSLTGKTTGRLLWDVQRRVLFQRVETSELTGTFDLPQMGMTGMPVTARSSSRVTLQ